MSCKMGNKAHKACCERYKQQNRRAVNKAEKAKQHEKRTKKFADRKAAGKCYQYDKKRTEQKRNDRVPIGSNLGSGKGRHTEVAKQDSVNSFLNKIHVIQQKEIAKRFAKKETKEES